MPSSEPSTTRLKRCGSLRRGASGVVVIVWRYRSCCGALRDEVVVEIRAEVVTAVGLLQVADVVPALLDLLGEEQDAVRLTAAEALGRIGDTSAAHALIDALVDWNGKCAAPR